MLAKTGSVRTFQIIKHFYTSNAYYIYLLSLITIAILGLFFSSCSAPSNVENAIDEKILHFGLGAEPQYLDPHLASSVSAHNVIIALIEGLVSEDPKTLKPVPGVAERWDISEDGLLYTFYLRKNAKWSNGDPVTAHDFVYSYKRILNPNLASQYASMLHGLKNARKYHEGSRVLSFEILNAGQKYSNGSKVSLIGSGTGFLGRLETNASGSITDVQILEAGKNYSSYQSIEIFDENGTGAKIRPLIGNLSRE